LTPANSIEVWDTQPVADKITNEISGCVNKSVETGLRPLREGERERESESVGEEKAEEGPSGDRH
jgi:hypothetical protein